MHLARTREERGWRARPGCGGVLGRGGTGGPCGRALFALWALTTVSKKDEPRSLPLSLSQKQCIIVMMRLFLIRDPNKKQNHKNRHSTLARPLAMWPRDTAPTSEEVGSNGASHNWLALTSRWRRSRDMLSLLVKNSRLGGRWRNALREKT